jgi:serine/threonine-protein kinase
MMRDMSSEEIERRARLASSLLEATGRTVHYTLPATVVDLPSESLVVPPVSMDGAQSDFDVAGTIGEGGMGRVLLARQRSLARDVAIKTLKDDASPRDRAALVREARVSGSLEHPGIVPVHTLGADGAGRPLLVMKRIVGVDWETLLRNPDHAAWRTVIGEAGDRLDASLEILGRVCRALELAHDRGVIHRDVKPSNVMVGSFGEVYLVDWGLATAKGTEYFPPLPNS